MTVDAERTSRRKPRRHLSYHAVRGRVGPRIAIAILGIAVSTVLAIVLLASGRGVTADIRSYIAQPGADLWVAPRGVDNFIRSAGLMSPETVQGVRRMPGVASAGALLRSFVTVKGDDSHEGRLPRGLNLMAVGYEPEVGLGGPPRFAEGHAPDGTAQVAVDRAAAFRLRLDRGDTAKVNDIPMTVVGVTGGTNLIATQFAFFDLAAVESASGYVQGQASFVVVRVADGAAAEDVRLAIERAFPDVSVHHAEAFLENNLYEAMAGFEPFQRLVTIVGLVAAAALVAMLLQGIVEDRKSELAVMLAMGTPHRDIMRALIGVAVITATSGVAAGTVFAVWLGEAAKSWFPTLTIDVRATDALVALAVFIFVALCGATLPVLRLRRIDPVESFRP